MELPNFAREGASLVPLVFFEEKCNKPIYFWRCYTDENESCRVLVNEGTSLVII